VAGLHDKVLSGRSLIDALNVYGYTVAATLHEVLGKCGDNLTRENVMREAARMKDGASIRCCRNHHHDQSGRLRPDPVGAAGNASTASGGALRRVISSN